MTNKKAGFPLRNAQLLTSMDDRYIYSQSGDHVTVFDTMAQEIVAKLRNLRDSKIDVSDDGRYFVCNHPTQKTASAQICLYDIHDGHREIFRVRIKGYFHNAYPKFTHDGNNIIIHTGSYPSKVWMVNIPNGDYTCLYETEKTHYIKNIDCSERGILIAASPSIDSGLNEVLVHFEDRSSSPQITITDRNDEKKGEFADYFRHHRYAWWLDGKRILIEYPGLSRTKFQICDFDHQQLMPRVTYIAPKGFHLPRLSHDRKFVAGTSPSVGFESFANVFRIADGNVIFSERRPFLWNASISSNSKYVLLCADKSEMIPLMNDA